MCNNIVPTDPTSQFAKAITKGQASDSIFSSAVQCHKPTGKHKTHTTIFRGLLFQLSPSHRNSKPTENVGSGEQERKLIQ